MQRDFSFEYDAPHICDPLMIFLWIAVNFVPWTVNQVFCLVQQFISNFVRKNVFIHQRLPVSNKAALLGPRPDRAISSLGLVFLPLPSLLTIKRPSAF